MLLGFRQFFFLLHPTKDQRTFLILKNIPDHLRPAEVSHTHTEGAFRPASAKDSDICREILTKQMTSSAGGGFSNERALKANGTPLRHHHFRGLAEDHFRFTASDAERGLFEALEEDHLKRQA